MKKIFKFIFKGLIGITLLSIIIYYSFLGWEYYSGRKYVDYLSSNTETVEIDDSFSYELMNQDIEQSKLILVGEIHGLDEPAKFDIHFFKHLYHNYGVRTYIAELDYAQANLMNTYLETGNDSLLHFILKNWIVIQGRHNKDYFDKYRAFHKFYQQLSENDKFKFIGVDKIQDWNVMTSFINQLSDIDSTLKPIIYENDTVITKLHERVNHLISLVDLDPKIRFELDHLLKNIKYKEEKIRRETVMFQNFHDVYEEFNLRSEKVYGYFGVFHVFQYRIDGKHPFASQIRQSDLGLKDKILSMNFLFTDSYMVMDSKMLPEFMRDEGKYSKIPISSDNIWFMYIYGIRDFKRVTEENHKSLIKMNGDENPYKNSGRLTKTFQIFPVVPTFEMTDKGKPYIQYTIFVRNSDWAEPIKN